MGAPRYLTALDTPTASEAGEGGGLPSPGWPPASAPTPPATPRPGRPGHPLPGRRRPRPRHASPAPGGPPPRGRPAGSYRGRRVRDPSLKETPNLPQGRWLGGRADAGGGLGRETRAGDGRWRAGHLGCPHPEGRAPKALSRGTPAPPRACPPGPSPSPPGCIAPGLPPFGYEAPSILSSSARILSSPDPGKPSSASACLNLRQGWRKGMLGSETGSQADSKRTGLSNELPQAPTLSPLLGQVFVGLESD